MSSLVILVDVCNNNVVLTSYVDDFVILFGATLTKRNPKRACMHEISTEVLVDNVSECDFLIKLSIITRILYLINVHD